MGRTFGRLGIAGKIGTEALRVNPLRTALSTLAVIIGVAFLVAVLSLGDGMERTARSRLETTTGLQSISIASRTVESVDGDVFPLPDTLELRDENATALRRLPAIVALHVSVRGRREVRTDDGVRRMATVTAVQWNGVSDRPSAHGRLLSGSDDSAVTAPVVVSQPLATRLSPGAPERLLGRMLRLGDDSALVIGVDAAGGDPRPGLTTLYRFAGYPARRASQLTPIDAIRHE